MTPADAPTLRDNPVLDFKSGTHTYAIRTSEGRSVYSVTAVERIVSEINDRLQEFKSWFHNAWHIAVGEGGQ